MNHDATELNTTSDEARDRSKEPDAVEYQEDIGTFEDLDGDGIPDDLDDEGLDDLLADIDPDDIETPNDDDKDDDDGTQ